MSRVVKVQVSDKVASQMADEMRDHDEHPWAACVQILARDRKELRDWVAEHGMHPDSCSIWKDGILGGINKDRLCNCGLDAWRLEASPCTPRMHVWDPRSLSCDCGALIVSNKGAPGERTIELVGVSVQPGIPGAAEIASEALKLVGGSPPEGLHAALSLARLVLEAERK